MDYRRQSEVVNQHDRGSNRVTPPGHPARPNSHDDHATKMTSPLRKRVRDFIDGARDTSFGELALALHAHQRVRNLPYARFCAGRPVPRSWTEIPTVPTDVFRYAALFCGESSEVGVTFRTSGTTDGARGEHHLRDTGVYHASALAQIRRNLPTAKLAALMLAPTPAQLPDSSLSSMLGLMAEQHCAGATFAWDDGGLDVDAGIEWIAQAAAHGVPVQILATSFALVHVLDIMASRGLAARLATGSVLMTTGGFKGKSRSLDPDQLDALARTHLGDVEHVVEYGMTELGSQLWGRHGGPLHAPPWCRVTAHDPQTLSPVSDGVDGILRFTDLSNIDSVVSVQTSDLGSVVARADDGDAIALRGRLGGARPRGCSLLVDELLAPPSR